MLACLLSLLLTRGQDKWIQHPTTEHTVQLWAVGGIVDGKKVWWTPDGAVLQDVEKYLGLKSGLELQPGADSRSLLLTVKGPMWGQRYDAIAGSVLLNGSEILRNSSGSSSVRREEPTVVNVNYSSTKWNPSGRFSVELFGPPEVLCRFDFGQKKWTKAIPGFEMKFLRLVETDLDGKPVRSNGRSGSVVAFGRWPARSVFADLQAFVIGAHGDEKRINVEASDRSDDLGQVTSLTVALGELSWSSLKSFELRRPQKVTASFDQVALSPKGR